MRRVPQVDFTRDLDQNHHELIDVIAGRFPRVKVTPLVRGGQYITMNGVTRKVEADHAVYGFRGDEDAAQALFAEADAQIEASREESLRPYKQGRQQRY